MKVIPINKLLYLVLALTLPAALCAAESASKPDVSASAAFGPVELCLAHTHDPVGIDDPTPSLRWSIRADGREFKQRSYSVRIASRPELLQKPDVWESGQVNSDRQEANIPESVKLLNGGRYFWQVRIWNQEGHSSGWSEVHGFSMGIHGEDWTAGWMTPSQTDCEFENPIAGKGKVVNVETVQSPTWWMRRTVQLESVPERVALAIVCLGYYELYINGQRVGDEPLAPSVTKLDRRGLCVTYEVGGLLRPGENVIALACASGWYLPHQFKVHERSSPLIRLQAYSGSGTALRTLFGSDNEWFARESDRKIIGPWAWNLFGGEAVDGRVESSKWNSLGFSGAGWHPVRIVSSPPIAITARTCPPNRIGARYQAKKIRKLDGGGFEIDFGLCLAGFVRFQFRDVPRDRKIVMRFYDLPADNTRNKDHSYNQLSTYIARGDGSDCFENKFNYAGFRYVTIQGLDAPPDLEDLQAMLVETGINPVGSFRCSNELFNRIHELNAHTLRCLNLGGYHVDCPHRERNGYGADGQTALPAYPYLFESEAFLHKWLIDWIDVFDPSTGRIPQTAPIKHNGESPAWGGIVGPLAWQLYVFYGDRRALELAFPVVRENLKRLQSAVRDGVLKMDLSASPFHGEWLPPGRDMKSKTKPTKPMRELFNTAYLIYLWQTYAKMAQALGDTAEVARAEETIASLRKSFHGNFFNKESGLYLVAEQAYQAMPLWVGAVPEENRDAIHKKLIQLIEKDRNGHLGTGLPTTTFLLDYLEQSDRHDTISMMMSKETYPSWGYMLAQGATTIWEEWDGSWSQIHSCFAGPASWFYSGLAGIRPDPEHPGFEVFELRPAFVDGLDFVEASYRSVRGPIGSSWRRNGQRIQWTVTIPPNTRARVCVPCRDPKKISLDGKPLTLKTETINCRNYRVLQCVQLPSGTWSLEW